MATNKQVILYRKDLRNQTFLLVGDKIKVVKIGHQYHLETGYIVGYTSANQYQAELDYKGKAGKSTVTLSHKLCKLQEFEYRAKQIPEQHQRDKETIAEYKTFFSNHDILCITHVQSA